MIPKSQKKIIQQKRNSRDRVINSINNRRVINSQRSNRPTFDNTTRKIINQKRVGFAAFSPTTSALPQNTVYYNGNPVYYNNELVIYSD